MRGGLQLSRWRFGRLIVVACGISFQLIQYAAGQATQPAGNQAFMQAKVGPVRTTTPMPVAPVLAAPVAAALVPAQPAVNPESEAEAFVVRRGDPAIADALAVIDEAGREQKWEKVFEAVAKVMDAPTDSLVKRADGFYVSARAHAQRQLVQLSPAGRDAYRLFNDATARKALEQIEAPDRNEPLAARIARLQGLFDRYFVTSVGDQIADRLGDARFESGDFSGAANAWASISSDYPDTSIPAVRTLVKRAIALSRAGRWDDLTVVLGQLKEKYADQSVRLGGKEVAVAELLDFAPGSPISAAPQVEREPKGDRVIAVNLLPRAGAEPSWQMLFRDETVDPQLTRAEAMPMGNGGYDPSFIVPSTVTTSDRIYLNWLGIGIAVDAETGKLLWRSEPFNRVVPRVQQMVMTGSDTGESAIALSPGRDKLILTNGTSGPRMVPIQAIGGFVGGAGGRVVQPQFVRVGVRGSGVMSCLSTQDGRLVWSSESEQLPELCSLNILGQPLLIDDTVYAVTTPVYMGSELSLLAVAMSNGSIKWKIPLGSMGSGMNYRGVVAMSKPVLLRSGDRIYVLTGCGALVAVDVPSKRVEWVFTYPTSPMMMGRVSGVYRKPAAQEFSSSMRLEGGVLYFKEKGSNVVYAVDTAGPVVRWQRPVDRDATIVAVDSTGLYVLGEELSAIDLATREMRWSAPTPLGSRQFQPWVEGSRAYVFGLKGVCAVDMKTSATETFESRAGGGGAVLRLGDRMICVSNRSVTAYEIPRAGGGDR